MRNIFRLIFIVLGIICPAVLQADDVKTILIINSYNESSPWSKAITMPINNHVSHLDGIKVELVHINNTTITDSTSYYKRTNRIFAKFQNKAPDYIVMLGNMAFNMRERIKEEWGDVPILLVARQTEYGPLNYYFSDYESPATDEQLPSLTRLRDKYNFTVVLMPDLYAETVDLMVKLIPTMDRFVFISDGIYLNRVLASNVSEYIAGKYPHIDFEWLHASLSTAEYLQEYLVKHEPNTGLLMSTWFYEMMDVNDYPVLVTGELNLISGSINPIFSLRQSYMNLGAVGGVYPDYEVIKSDILKVIDAMLAGKSMRELPFYTSIRGFPILNYPMMEEYDLNPEDCPDDTVFIDRPESWWHHYRVAVLTFLLIALISGFIIWHKSETHAKAKEVLQQTQAFVNHMPVPYSRALVHFDDMSRAVSISFTMKNEAFERMIEKNGNKDNPYSLFPESFILEKTDKLFATHKPVSFLYHFEKTDTYYDFLLCVVDIGSHTEKAVRVIDVFATDVTDSYKLSSRLEKASSKLALVLNAANLVPWQWDVQSDIITFDDFNIKQRYSPEAIEHDVDAESSITLKDYLKIVHPEDMHLLVTLHKNIIDGKVKDFLLQYRTHLVSKPELQNYEWGEISGMVTRYADDGKAAVVTGSMLIVTERKHQEEEMKKAMDRANESDYLKSAFLANMSHEIRTPLNSIVGFSSLIAKTDSKEKREEFASIIEKNNEMLINIVNDVLDLAKIEANTIDLSYAPTNVNDVVQRVAETLQIRVPKGVVLNLALGAQKCIVNTDETRLAQILMNLLSNACKFTTRGSITVGYDVQDGDELYFYIKDTGIGLSPENQTKIFERFVKVNSFVQGTGLGLPICKSIVEKMGGEMGVRSRGEGAGSTFWFTLPYIAADKPDDSFVDQMASEVEKDGSLLPKHLGLPDTEILGTILVAEDNHSNYRLVEHLLGRTYKLVRAENGEEAVELFIEHKPDIIIMDISMPVMDGYEATRQIRKLSTDVPIIAVTAYALNSDRARILESGFNAFVSKPISQKELIQALMDVTNREIH